MATFNPGYLIAMKKGNSFYYYLIVSKPMFFGCQWAYAFHRTSNKLLRRSEILSGFGKGFHALIDFNKEYARNDIQTISREIDISPYRVKWNSKLRIDKPDGGHVWYIFSPQLQILRKQNSLKSDQFNLPVASGITCREAKKLIDKKWKTEQIVEEEGEGQFPI